MTKSEYLQYHLPCYHLESEDTFSELITVHFTNPDWNLSQASLLNALITTTKRARARRKNINTRIPKIINK
jgi:hypothetical protein